MAPPSSFAENSSGSGSHFVPNPYSSTYEKLVTPVPRKARFDWGNGEQLATWNSNGRFVSYFLNGLSLFFPPGEAMFVKAVQAHKDVAKDDPVLQKQIQAFVLQESVHGREHELYNKFIQERYPAVRITDSVVGAICSAISNYLPDRSALGATVALEHWTGLLSEHILGHPYLFANSTPHYSLLWRYHACEENEHKAVAYDVFIKSYGYTLQGWFHRFYAQVLATILLWFFASVNLLIQVVSDGQLLNIGEWRKLFHFLWNTKDGQFYIIFFGGGFMDYFAWSFHPWQPNHDNRKDVVREVAKVEKELTDMMTSTS